MLSRHPLLTARRQVSDRIGVRDPTVIIPDASCRVWQTFLTSIPVNARALEIQIPKMSRNLRNANCIDAPEPSQQSVKDHVKAVLRRLPRKPPRTEQAHQRFA